MSDPSFDLSTTHIHLGLGTTAHAIPDFAWTPEYLAEYTESTVADGEEGRLVLMNWQDTTWNTWERHPAGDEVVVLLSGRVDVIQDIDGEHRIVKLRPGRAVVDPH